MGGCLSLNRGPLAPIRRRDGALHEHHLHVCLSIRLFVRVSIDPTKRGVSIPQNVAFDIKVYTVCHSSGQFRLECLSLSLSLNGETLFSYLDISTQGNPISGYRRLRDFGGKQMTSGSDRVCTYPILIAYILII